MSLTIKTLIGLLAGIAAGIALSEWGGRADALAVATAGPIGKAWLNALQMPLIPLIFGLLVTGVATAAGAARHGGITVRTLTIFAIMLVGSATYAALFGSAYLAAWHPPANAIAAMSGLSATNEIGDVRPSLEWLVGFIPVNPIKAAAEGQVVGIVLFALFFGFATTRLPDEPRAGLLGVIGAMTDALMILVGWVLKLAPIGVFALGLVAGSRSGLATVGALAHYILFIVAICFTTTLLMYPVAVMVGRISLPRFARAVLPSQVIAFSTQSSIASLPAMIAASDDALGVRPQVRSIVLPLAISLFRITSPAANLAVAMYVASLHGIALGPAQLAIGVVVSAIVNLAAVGLPGQITFFTTTGPICLAMGVPVDALPFLLAVETVPDIFRTVGNVTADLAVTRIVDVTGAATEETGE